MWRKLACLRAGVGRVYQKIGLSDTIEATMFADNICLLRKCGGRSWIRFAGLFYLLYDACFRQLLHSRRNYDASYYVEYEQAEVRIFDWRYSLRSLVIKSA
jgi:hypothetical protein